MLLVHVQERGLSVLREEQPGPETWPGNGEVHSFAAAAGARLAVTAPAAKTTETTLQLSTELSNTTAHEEKILPEPQIVAQSVRAARAPLARQPRAPLR